MTHGAMYNPKSSQRTLEDNLKNSLTMTSDGFEAQAPDFGTNHDNGN